MTVEKHKVIVRQEKDRGTWYWKCPRLGIRNDGFSSKDEATIDAEAKVKEYLEIYN